MLKKNITIPVLFSLLIFSVFLNYKLIKANNHYRNLIPHVIKGEQITNVNLLDKDGQPVDQSKLKEETSIIYIFKKDCSPCDKNIVFWKKIAKIFKGKIAVYGVVLNTPTEAFNFAEKAKLNFDIFVPDNLDQYLRDMKLKENRSQTIVCRSGRVQFVKIGIMQSEDAKAVIKQIKRLI